MRKLLSFVCLLAFALSARAEDLSVILKRMDAAAPSLRSMSSDIQLTTYTAVIDDKSVDHGTFKMQKGKNGSVRAVVDFTTPKDHAREIGFFGKMVRIYYPNAGYYQDYDLGSKGNLMNQFLLLGFGSSGEELSKSYTITPEGTEKVSGVDTTKLLLDPKDPKVKEHLSKIEIWIPEGQANPIQQQFYEPSGNYNLATYSQIVQNPSIKGNLEIQMPSGTQKR